MIDVNPNHLETVKRILAEHVPDCEVRVFGSRVTWTAKGYSDLDLAVFGPRALDADRLLRLKEEFEESDVPFRVDVIDWHTISASFRKVIEKKFEVVQKGNKKRRAMAGSRWTSIRLGAVCSKIGSGATPRGGSDVYLDTGPYALIRSQNVYNNRFHQGGLAFIGEEHATQLQNVEVFKDDVLLNITGDSVARVCQVDPAVLPARVNQHVAIIRPDPDKLAPRFLRYFLVSPEMQTRLLSWAGSGGTRNALTKGMIESFEVLAPMDVTEQRAIAHILGALDDKIELNRRMNETLEAMARAIFKSWFIDFDPVRMNMARKRGQNQPSPRPSPRGRGREGNCGEAMEPSPSGRGWRGAPGEGLSPEILRLFPDSLIDSEMGEMPEGWEVGTVGDEYDLTMGQSPPGNTYNEAGEGLPFYQGRADFTFRFPTRRVYCTAPTRFARAGDTLISVRAPVGDINMASEDCAIGRGVAAARHKTGSRSYTYQFMRSLEEVFSRFEAEGTVFGSINKNDFRSITVAKPLRCLVVEYEKRISSVDDRIEVNERESRTLAALRDTLLPKLLSGEIRVKDAEKFIHAAVKS